MLLICIKIFLARIVDVSLGTIRTIMTIKRKTLMASIIAFVEVFIWFVIAKEALNIPIDTLWIPFSYSLGYAFGTFIGSFISNTLVNDEMLLEMIVSKDYLDIIDIIRNKGYKISILELVKEYDQNDRYLLLIQIKRKDINRIVNLCKKNISNSFMVINEIQKIK